MTTTAVTSGSTDVGPIANLTIYWRVSGFALAAVAALGILLNTLGSGSFVSGFLEFDWTHNLVHVLLAAVALGVGYSSMGTSASAALAKTIGIVYLGLGVVGFFMPDVLGFLGLHLETGENLVHLVIGAWGAYAGFSN